LKTKNKAKINLREGKINNRIPRSTKIKSKKGANSAKNFSKIFNFYVSTYYKNFVIFNYATFAKHLTKFTIQNAVERIKIMTL